MYIYRDIYFKELAYVIVEVQFQNLQGTVAKSVWGPGEEFQSAFFLLRPSADWMKSTYVMVDNMLNSS